METCHTLFGWSMNGLVVMRAWRCGLSVCILDGGGVVKVKGGWGRRRVIISGIH